MQQKLSITNISTTLSFCIILWKIINILNGHDKKKKRKEKELHKPPFSFFQGGDSIRCTRSRGTSWVFNVRLITLRGSLKKMQKKKMHSGQKLLDCFTCSCGQ
jgi:hypothetical protein